MFEQIAIDGSRHRSPWTFAASLTIQTALVTAALAVPLLHIAAIDARPRDILYMPRPIGNTEPIKQARAQNSNASASSILRDRVYKPYIAPTSIPKNIATGPDTSGPPDAPPGLGLVGQLDGAAGIPLGIESKPLSPPPPPEPVRKPQSAPSQPTEIVVGTGIQAAKLVFGPRPEYPPLAKQARITGTVRLAARISTDGHILGLKLMSGHPMLAPAALQAVSRWVYSPTLLNGRPVEVLTDIEVNFVLNQ